MAQKTFINSQGKVIARGDITQSFIDLIFNDGTRYYSTQSDRYSTLNFIKSLDIVKVINNND